MISITAYIISILILIIIFILVYNGFTVTNTKRILTAIGETLPDRYWRSDIKYIVTEFEAWQDRTAVVPEDNLRLTIPTVTYFNVKFTAALDNFAKSRNLSIIFDKANLFNDNVTFTITQLPNGQ
jgi:hypothetical protein